MPELVHSIRIIFGAQTQPSITIQQSDYNSRKIQAACFTSSGQPMDFTGETVTVVYNSGADPTKEYPVTVEGNILFFYNTRACSHKQRGHGACRISFIGRESLLHSAEFLIHAENYHTGTGGDDPVPALVLLIQQAQVLSANAIKPRKMPIKRWQILKRNWRWRLHWKNGDTGPQGFQGVGVTAQA